MTRASTRLDTQPQLVSRRNLVTLAIFLLALYVIVPQFGSFRDSFASLRTTDLAIMTFAGIPLILSYLIAGLIYVVLCKKHPIKVWPTMLVQLATAFTNRLLPAGIGGMGLKTLYLQRRGYKTAEAATIALLNNLLGFVADILLILYVSLITKRHELAFDGIRLESKTTLAIVAVLITLITLPIIFPRLRRTISKQFTLMVAAFMSYRREPMRLLLAFIGATLVTLMYTFMLQLSAQAIGVDLSLYQALLVSSAGAGAGSFLPTPGGLGGVEAGMVAVLLACGVNQPQSLVIALNFRFLTYWLPILPGIVGFQLSKKYKLI